MTTRKSILDDGKTVVFISSDEPLIGRGWDTRDVSQHLRDWGIATARHYVDSEAMAKALLKTFNRNRTIFWPASFTIGSSAEGTLLVSILEDLNFSFISSNSKSLQYSSKIHLKRALEATEISTPRFLVMTRPDLDCSEIGFPLLLKCEYSCDSRGVELIRNPNDIASTWTFLHETFGQRIFVEEWARSREYTVSYIPSHNGGLVGAVEISLAPGIPYITKKAKQSNNLLKFERLSHSEMQKITSLIQKLVALLGIDGYFRVDILEDEAGFLHVIDLNYLPQLHLEGNEVSYFPIAFRESIGLSVDELLIALLRSATRSPGLQGILRK